MGTCRGVGGVGACRGVGMCVGVCRDIGVSVKRRGSNRPASVSLAASQQFTFSQMSAQSGPFGRGSALELEAVEPILG